MITSKRGMASVLGRAWSRVRSNLEQNEIHYADWIMVSDNSIGKTVLFEVVADEHLELDMVYCYLLYCGNYHFVGMAFADEGIKLYRVNLIDEEDDMHPVLTSDFVERTFDESCERENAFGGGTYHQLVWTDDYGVEISYR